MNPFAARAEGWRTNGIQRMGEPLSTGEGDALQDESLSGLGSGPVEAIGVQCVVARPEY